MKRSICFLTLLAFVASPVLAEETTETEKKPLTYLVPEMEGGSFAIQDGKRPYQNRLSFSPAFGELGTSKYYAFRIGYAPNRWLGYEANVGHNPSESVHALVNSLHTTVRYPLPGRIQPYLSAGFGMMFVFPGAIFKADPVTKNVASFGGGLEIFLREDVALRGEYRGMTLLGGPDDSGAELSYGEYTVGLSFFRTLQD